MKYCSSCQASYPLDYTACPKDQTPLQRVTDLMPGLILRGKYEILEKLGEGGMGAVYKARHLAFDELRAIKFVGANLQADESVLARFRAEAVVARRLQHPNAVKVEDLDTTEDGRPYIVMEYVLGQSLRELFREEREVKTKRALALARQACAALGAAHALGIVHRDIKPANRMIVPGPDGTEILKVADFGLAKVREGFGSSAEKGLTQTGVIVGTPPYMSPEQASGSDVDGRSDLYSLGVVLYEIFTGRLPFRSNSPLGMLVHHLETPPPPPAGLGVPRPLSGLLLKALEKRREDRFSTAEQMDEAIRLASLMPLPEFVGEGISEGFEPHWAGSGHASQMTTVQGAVPKTVLIKKSGSPGTGPRSVKTVVGPSSGRRLSPVVDEEVPQSSSSSSARWLGLGVAAFVAVGLLMRQGPEPKGAPSPSPSIALAPIEAPQAATARSEPVSERSDTAIRFDIDRRLDNSTPLQGAPIKVEVTNGVATLMGEAPNETVMQLATTLAAGVPGVRQVFSTVRVSAPVQAAASAGVPAPAAFIPTATPLPTTWEPVRPVTPSREDSTQGQVRELLDRARQRIDSGDHDGAEADFRAVLKLDPNNGIAQDALERGKNRPRGPGGGGPPGGPRGPGPRPTPFLND